MINNLYLFYAFWIGAIFASFCSAIAWRTHHKAKIAISSKIPDQVRDDKSRYSIIFGRSMCPHCEKTLPWWALIPVLSYVFFGGRCFNCKKRISLLYPLAELVAGIFGFFITAQFLNDEINLLNLILIVFIFFVLIILSFQDLWFEEISDKVALPAIGIGFVIKLIDGVFSNNFNGFITAVILTSVLLLIFGFIVVFTDTMGGGDLRVFALMGIVLSFEQMLFALTISFILATFFGSIYLILKKQKSILKSHVRLIPFLTLGYAVIILVGDLIFKYLMF